MGFTELPGPNVPVTLTVIPAMAKLITDDGYTVLSGVFCEHHGFGVMILADRDTVLRHEKLEDVKADVKCMLSSFKEALLVLGSDGESREQRTDHE